MTSSAILQEWKRLNYIREDNNRYYTTKYFEKIIEDPDHEETEIESDLSMFGRKEFTFEEWKNRDMASRS